MELLCPKCGRPLGEVKSIARLILTVHCPYEGHDFGVAVEPVVAEDAPAVTVDNPTVTQT